MSTSTSDAGMFATLPCSVRSISACSPTLLTNVSRPGWPAHSNPHRASHSLKPSSHPSPPRAFRFTYLRVYHFAHGRVPASRRSPMTTRRIPIPRVGTSVIVSRPLSMVTRSTASWRPPYSRCFRTDQDASGAMPVSLPVICQFPTSRFRSALMSRNRPSWPVVVMLANSRIDTTTSAARHRWAAAARLIGVRQ